jgi:hypothetical protein
MKKTNLLARTILTAGLFALSALAQDDAMMNELSQITQLMGSGAEPCSYMPRLKAVLKKMAAENPALYTAMAPALVELDKANSCAPAAPPVVRQAPPRPQTPAVTMPRGTAFALPPGATTGSPLDNSAARAWSGRLTRPAPRNVV